MIDPPQDTNDVGSTAKIIGNLFLSGLLAFFRRHVGWIPFLAFWINVAYFFLSIPISDLHTFRDVFVTIKLLIYPFYSMLFFAVAVCQFLLYRKNSERTVRLAGFSIIAHGCALLYIKIFWLFIA
jgi:hypothetical protein